MKNIKMGYLWITMCALSLLILVCFGAYSFSKPIETEKEIIKTDNYRITFNDARNIDEVISPGFKKEISFKIENLTDKEIIFKLRWEDLKNKVLNKESFVNTLKENNNILLNKEMIVDSAVNYPIYENIIIEPNKTKEYTFIVELKKEDYNQEKDINKHFKGTIEVVLQNKEDGYLKNNPVYKIDYDLNGGYLEKENPTTYTKDTPTFILNNPKKLGYIFDGWSSEGKDATTLLIVQKGSTGDKLFKANYKANTYQIKYNANGGVGEMSNTVAYYDEEIKLKKNKFKKQGYKFIGWSLKVNEEVTYEEKDNIINLTDVNNSVVNLYAVWEEK